MGTSLLFGIPRGSRKKKPKDIALLIYEASTRKRWKVKHVLANNAWIYKIKMDANLTVRHIHEYIWLWVQLKVFQLVEDA
jgi:hypothetical protein